MLIFDLSLLLDSRLGLLVDWPMPAPALSIALLRFSITVPPPPMTTGASLSRKKSSISGSPLLVTLLLRLEAVRAALPEVSLALVDLARLPLVLALPLRPLRAYLPYPSCPVPAVGPFLVTASASSELVAFGRLENRPNLDEDLPDPALMGLAPLVKPGLGPASCAGGNRPLSNLCGDASPSTDDSRRVGDVCLAADLEMGSEL